MKDLIRDRCLVGSEWIAAFSKEVIEVSNPATGEVISTVPNCGAKETELAIDKAYTAFSEWKKVNPAKRGALLRALYLAINENINELSTILTLEQGKPLSESKREISYGASYFEWFSEEAKRIYGEVLPSFVDGKRILVTKEPVGVCAAITPWNFPHAMIARKMGAALAAGCTFIARPASETPLSALALGALVQSVGFPPGVVQIVTGDAVPIAKAIMESDKVRKVTFTGSTEVGKILIRQSAETVKRMTMELGGNAPFIVFEDASIEQAVRDGIFAKFRNAGQTCICSNRILVHEGIAKNFTERFVAEVKKLKVGPGIDDPDLGPLNSSQAKEKVELLLKDAVNKGARVVTGGVSKERSLFMEPTVITGIKENMRLNYEEVFGPLAPIATFSTEEEAIKRANDTEFGLAAYIYTKDLARAFRVSEALEYGMVGVNDTAISTAQIPFGGVKHSGFGREGGHYGVEEYLNIKYTSVGI